MRTLYCLYHLFLTLVIRADSTLCFMCNSINKKNILTKSNHIGILFNTVTFKILYRLKRRVCICFLKQKAEPKNEVIFCAKPEKKAFNLTGF